MRVVGFLRFIVVFLVGLGVALGAYATGTLDSMAHSHYLASWYPWPHHDMVLRVADDAPGSDFCATRYAIDNRSNRRVLVVFAPPAHAHLNGAPIDARGSYGYEGPERPRYASAFGSEDAYGARDAYHDEDAGEAPVDDARRYRPDVAADDSSANGLDSAPFVVEPGEQKLVGPAYGGQPMEYAVGRYGTDDGAAMASGGCGAGHVVTLQLTDCAADGGACVAATNSPGGAPQINQGDE